MSGLIAMRLHLEILFDPAHVLLVVLLAGKKGMPRWGPVHCSPQAPDDHVILIINVNVVQRGLYGMYTMLPSKP